MTEWKRIASNRKRICLMLCIPLICLFLFLYRDTMDAMIAPPQEYEILVNVWRDSDPEEILEALSGQYALSENEMRLQAQAEYLLEYPAYLERIQDQAYKMQQSSIFGADKHSYVYRNIIKTAKDFALCSGEGITLGNDRIIRQWLAFSAADWGYLAAVLLMVMSFLDERKNGLAAIVRSTPGGQVKLQLTRLLIMLIYSGSMTLLLYYLPLLISFIRYGGWEDLFRQIQSIVEFQKCTANLNVAGFLTEFFFVKTACGFLLGVLIWFALSFLEQIQLCWMVTTAGLTVEYFLYTLIPAQSIFSPLRYVNVFSYVFTSRLYTEYVNINFFSWPIGKSPFLLCLLMICGISLSAILTILIPKRYPFGNCNRLGKLLDLWNQAGDFLRRRLGVLGFEWYKLLFLTAGGLLLIMGFLFSRDLPLNSRVYSSLDDRIYQQYVSQIQGPVTQSTFDYIDGAWKSLENAEMDTSDFEAALIRLEQTIELLPDGAWLVDDTMFLNIYGSESWFAQRNTALIALLILCASLSPLFSPEQNGDLKRVHRSTPKGREHLFRTKIVVALGVTASVWLMVFVQEWHCASELLGEIILKAPCTSIEMVKAFPGTVGAFLAALCIIKGFALLIPMSICVFIGAKCGVFEKVFLISGLTIVLPATAIRFGAHGLSILSPINLLADGNILFVTPNSLIKFAIWAVLSVTALFIANRSWCRQTR